MFRDVRHVSSEQGRLQRSSTGGRLEYRFKTTEATYLWVGGTVTKLLESWPGWVRVKFDDGEVLDVELKSEGEGNVWRWISSVALSLSDAAPRPPSDVSWDQATFSDSGHAQPQDVVDESGCQCTGDARTVSWVQCEAPGCGKWRRLPPSLAPTRLPEVFECFMAHWMKAPSCTTPEHADESEAIPVQERKFNPTSSSSQTRKRRRQSDRSGISTCKKQAVETREAGGTLTARAASVKLSSVKHPGLNKREQQQHQQQQHQQQQQQQQQQQRVRSRFVGVHWAMDKRRWTFDLAHNGHKVRGSTFADEEDAALAYDATARRIRGSRAHGGRARGNGGMWRLNFPTKSEASAAKSVILGHHGKRSQYIGVCWDKSRQRWLAQHTHKGFCQNLGRFDTEEEAARAWDMAARRARGAAAHGGLVEATGATQSTTARAQLQCSQWRLNFPTVQEKAALAANINEVARAQERYRQQHAAAEEAQWVGRIRGKL
jgi:hypothetical protein